jgi:UDP-glucose 4-epimerase
MRVLVTGGAGYIGSVTVERLVERGDEVVVLDDLSTGHRGAVAPGAELRAGDLLDRNTVAGALRGCEAVVHFAAKALVSESMRRPEIYWRVNEAGTQNLLEAMRDAGVRRFVCSSTCAVYGDSGGEPISESTPTEPINPYGASKLAMDELAAEEATKHGLAAISLRYFNVAGASARFGEVHDPETHLIPLVLRAAAGKEPVSVFGTDFPTPDGTAIRDYVHVEDLADAHLTALDALTPGEHRVYNLGSGHGHSVREVIAEVRRTLGVKVKAVDRERRTGDPPILVASAEKIARDLGWRPRRGLGQMIESAWTFAQAHPRGYA